MKMRFISALGLAIAPLMLVGCGNSGSGSGPGVTSSVSGTSQAATSASAGDCASGGACAVGDTGPGGGIVIAAGGSATYLEVAPVGWSGAAQDPPRDWPSATTDAQAYKGGGKNDWHLPSKDELNQMLPLASTLDLRAPVLYWSSTEFDANDAWSQSISDGTQHHYSKAFIAYVRPIRSQ